MTDFATNFNVQSLTIAPYVLIDEVSATEIYIGTSKSFGSGGAPNWRIKKISQDITTWMFQYPNGDQDFIYVWDDRLSYTYQ